MVCRLISFNTHNNAMEQGLLLLLFVVPTLRQKDWGSEMSTNSSEISRLVSGRPETCHLPTSPLSVPSSLQSIFWSGWAICSFLKAPGRSPPLCLCWAVSPFRESWPPTPWFGLLSPTHHLRPAQQFCSQETLLNQTPQITLNTEIFLGFSEHATTRLISRFYGHDLPST